MKRTEHPDGLRTLVTLAAETVDDLEALTKRLAGCAIEERVALAEALARRVLADAGLPTERGHYLRYNDGRIEPAPPEAANGSTFHPDADDLDHWECRTLAALAGGPAPSLAHDAALVLGYAAAVRLALAGGVDPAELARRAMRLGETFEHLRLSIANGWRLADAGRRHEKGRRKGGEVTRGVRAAEREVRRRIFGEVIAERPGANVEAWARAAAKRYTSAHPEKAWTREAARRFFYDHVRKV